MALYGRDELVWDQLADAGLTFAVRLTTMESEPLGADRLTQLNELPAPAARDELLACCSAPSWADRMAAGRPYCSVHDAVRQSAEIVARMTVTDLAEALAGQPRIGERTEAGHGPLRPAAWSAQEQSSVSDADTETARALAESNLEYERRFGHIYLVCASGRTAAQLLSLLRSDAPAEWQVVRSELQKINEVRLRKLLAGSP
ncbi:MAG: 2-oxo-4-hydroxy-4-carboxy-5-ureidoimidazoline decarboxylase [Streptosporangiaceae bacterium]